MADETTTMVIFALLAGVIAIFAFANYMGVLPMIATMFGSFVSGFFKNVIDSITGVGSGLIKYLLFIH